MPDTALKQVESILALGLSVQETTVEQLVEAIRPFIKTDVEDSIVSAARRLSELATRFVEYPSSSLDHQISLYTERLIILGRML